MFSYVFHRNTSAHTNAVPVEHAVQPQIQRNSNTNTEIPGFKLS